MKSKLKGLYGKAIVLLIIILNLWFTVRILDIVEAGNAEPSTLIVSWFAFTGTELVALAGIKVSKKRKPKENTPET